MDTTQIGLVPLHNMPLDRDDFPVEKNNEDHDSWHYTVRKQQYVPSAQEWEKVFFHKHTRDALTALLDSPPNTVGELIYKFLESKASAVNLYKNLTALHDGLAKINEWLNGYAEDNNMCQEYEGTLSRWNEMLRSAGYRDYFEFEGRREDIMVTVQRRRTIIETTSVCVSMARNDRDGAYEDALEMAGDIDIADWTEVDDCYSTDDYEAIDHETL